MESGVLRLSEVFSIIVACVVQVTEGRTIYIYIYTYIYIKKRKKGNLREFILPQINLYMSQILITKN